jgi:excisionase family DNA binding protein
MTEPAKPRRRAVPADDSRLMSIEDLMEYLGQSRDTIYKERQLGTGPPGYRLGKHLRWKKSEVDAWLASRRDQFGAVPPRQ